MQLGRGEDCREEGQTGPPLYDVGIAQQRLVHSMTQQRGLKKKKDEQRE